MKYVAFALAMVLVTMLGLLLYFASKTPNKSPTAQTTQEEKMALKSQAKASSTAESKKTNESPDKMKTKTARKIDWEESKNRVRANGLAALKSHPKYGKLNNRIISLIADDDELLYIKLEMLNNLSSTARLSEKDVLAIFEQALNGRRVPSAVEALEITKQSVLFKIALDKNGG